MKFGDIGFYIFLIAIAVLNGVMASQAIADEVLMPTSTHYMAAEKGSSCSVYRVMISRTLREIREVKAEMDEHIQSLKEARARLETCATKQGVDQYKGKNREAIIAELCEQSYNAWLRPSYRVHMVRQDLKTANKTLEEARMLVRSSCYALPKLTEASPTAKVF